MKKCIICQNNFPETEEFFHFRKDSQKFRNECKKCIAERSSQYHLTHKNDYEYKEKRRQKQKRFYEKYPEKKTQYYQIHKQEIQQRQKNNRRQNPVKVLLQEARIRSKLRGIEFNLSEEDISIPNTCPVFNIPLFVTDGKRTDHSYSLDRIDNSKGYIKGNVIVVSWKANRIKNDSSINDLETVVNFYKRL